MSYKVAFVQGSSKTQHGIMILSAVLKKSGFSTNVFSVELDQHTIIDEILKYQPELVCFSVCSPEYNAMVPLIDDVKKKMPRVFVIAGGPHPTFYPKIINENENLDAICRGEGEDALLELAISLRKKKLNVNIKNLYVRYDGKVIENELRELIADLDVLPFEDRDIYFEKYHFMAAQDMKFLFGRGCPFNCSYCFNKSMKEIYRQKGSWVRFKSLAYIIKEIQYVMGKYRISCFNFNDDTFNLNKKFVAEFLEYYRINVAIPFLCQLRIDFTDEAQIELLKKAGVDRITVGIEHGNEAIRQTILKRNISNEQIYSFGKWINARKIRLHTTNIIGLPNEDLQLAFETIKINQRIKPELAVYNVLTPYPDTDIYHFLKDNDLLTSDFSVDTIVAHNTGDGSTRVRSFVKNAFMPQLLNLRCFLMLLIFLPFLEPLVKLLIRLPNNLIYEFIWKATSYFRIEWKYAADWKERRIILKRLFSS